ncbi:unnamed protein product [Polarella glacialis]|uniref:Uncharacterized protein n=1 Tax=Polarella glacialis TaxID=89957 RepID=A0A813GR90_POLGL|nr:unnamed protein product [Polarella glacialis]
MTYDFKALSEVDQLPVDTLLDVKAVICSVKGPYTFTAKRSHLSATRVSQEGDPDYPVLISDDVSISELDPDQPDNKTKLLGAMPLILEVLEEMAEQLLEGDDLAFTEVNHLRKGQLPETLGLTGKSGALLVPSLDATPILKAAGAGSFDRVSVQVNSDGFNRANYIKFHPGMGGGGMRVEGPGGWDNQANGFKPAFWTASRHKFHNLHFAFNASGENLMRIEGTNAGEAFEKPWANQLTGLWDASGDNGDLILEFTVWGVRALGQFEAGTVIFAKGARVGEYQQQKNLRAQTQMEISPHHDDAFALKALFDERQKTRPLGSAAFKRAGTGARQSLQASRGSRSWCFLVLLSLLLVLLFQSHK